MMGRNMQAAHLHFDTFILELDVGQIPAFLPAVSGSFGYELMSCLDHRRKVLPRDKEWQAPDTVDA